MRRRKPDVDTIMKTAIRFVNCIIEAMGTKDWEAVRDIYQEGISTGNATVRTQAPTWEHWNNVHRPDCRLVARDGDTVLSAGPPLVPYRIVRLTPAWPRSAST